MNYLEINLCEIVMYDDVVYSKLMELYVML
jgi:hypothetical protein